MLSVIPQLCHRVLEKRKMDEAHLYPSCFTNQYKRNHWLNFCDTFLKYRTFMEDIVMESMEDEVLTDVVAQEFVDRVISFSKEVIVKIPDQKACICGWLIIISAHCRVNRIPEIMSL